MSSRADDVHIDVSIMKRGGEQFDGNVQFALSSLDVQITVRRKLLAKAIHRCCTYRRVNDDNWRQTYSRECSDRLMSLIKIGGESDRFIYLRRRLPANLFTAAVHSGLWWKLVRSAPTDSRNGNWCSKSRFPEMNRSPFRNWERKKPLSLLSASQLFVSDVTASWLARSFAKKNFKRNLWDKDSGEPFRRWFEIHRTGSPYRWTRL